MADYIIKSFSLNAKTDAQLIAKINGLKRGELSPLIRQALLSYLEMGNGVTLGMVYSKLFEMDRKLDSGVVVNDAQPERATDDDAQGERLSADELGGW